MKPRNPKIKTVRSPDDLPADWGRVREIPKDTFFEAMAEAMGWWDIDVTPKKVAKRRRK